jgi:ubiquinone/menaquinone biosynthesis C-methylase UbiE
LILMSIEQSELSKQQAIAVHSRQAEEFAASYNDLEASAYSTCFTYSRKRLDRWLDMFLPARGDGLRILDIGCGTGHHMARLRQRGFTVAGVDGSQEMLEHARANNPGATIEQADVERIPFGAGEFDFVLCVEVLRYLPDFTHCVGEIARVLKKGGTCLATAAPLLNSNGYWLINRAASSFRIGSLVQLKQYFTTSGRLRRAFDTAGFASTEIHGVYIGPINWVEHAAPQSLPRVLRAWEPCDQTLADLPLLREFSNMFVVRAQRADK